ncbi:hypothetical protein [Coleofasciculus sp.]|uniref:hypothetical protein n=1 Tax=Coleofasciculus sp. TaxID=3100458 RepID=UPI003A494367
MSNDGVVTTMDSALTMAEFCSFALGPEGLIIAGGISIVHSIFKQNLSSHKKAISTSEILDKALVSELVAQDLRNGLAAFKTTYDWFIEYYNSSWDKELDDSEELKNFKVNLNVSLGPNSPLTHFINLLEQSHYQLAGFSLFLLAAGQHIVLLKIDLILRSSNKKVVEIPALHILIDKLTEYINKANETINKINQKVSDRKDKVTKVTSHNGQYSFLDQGEGVKGTEYKYSDKDSAKIAREAVLEKLEGQLNVQYYGGNPYKALKIIKEWENTKQEYQEYMNS